MGTTCAWSNRPDAGTRPVELRPARRFEKPHVYDVCPDHEPLLRNYIDRLQRRRPHTVAALGAVFASALAPLFIATSLGLAIPLFVTGTTLIVFPYAAPLTVGRGGVAGAMRTLRVFGSILLVFAVIFAWLSLA